LSRRTIAILLLLCLIVIVIGGKILNLVTRDILLGTERVIERNSLSPSVGPNLINTIESRIPPGTERSKVTESLSDAWYHADCTSEDGLGYDLFLYGSRTREAVEVITVRYELVDNEMKVEHVGLLEEYLLANWDHCIPSGIFEELH